MTIILSKYDDLRKKMVESQIKNRGISDTKLLKVLEETPRHLFVSDKDKICAYDDSPLNIGNEQTISQPYMVALMTEKLELTGKEKVLEIGTGSGYQTAILAQLCLEVYTIDLFEKFVEDTRTILESLNIKNVEYFTGDGTVGIEEFSPYDRILVTAGSPNIPASLKNQLTPNGIMIIPVGDLFSQQLLKITKNKEEYIEEDICGCRFVPLKGKEGW